MRLLIGHARNSGGHILPGHAAGNNGLENIIRSPSDFSSADWVTFQLTKVSPSTSVNAVPTTVASVHSLYQLGISVPSGSICRLTVDAKANGYNFLALGLHNGAITAGNEALRMFDLATPAIGNFYNTEPNSSGSPVAAGGGYYRIFIEFTISTSTAHLSLWPKNVDQNPRMVNWSADGTSGVLIRNPKLEVVG